MGITIRITVDERNLVKLINATKGPIRPKIVSDGVNYGIYHEFGTVKMGARPCAAPAVESVRSGLVWAFVQANAISDVLAQGMIDKAARDVERLWKQNIITQDVIDTGAYLNSIHTVDASGQFSTEFESMRE